MLKFIFLFLFSTSYCVSQNINGTVFKQGTHIPIDGVNIYIKNTTTGTLSNHEGQFSLKIDFKIGKKDTLYVSHIGYKVVKIPLYKAKKNHRIYLVEKINELNKVDIFTQKQLKSRLRFTKLKSMDGGIHSFGSLLIGDKIYVIGGDVTFQVDALRKAIEEYPILSFTEQLEKARGYWTFQGYKGQLTTYDITNDTWTVDKNLKFRKRAYHNLSYHNDKIYVLGGKRLSTNRAFEYLEDKIEVFDLKNNRIEVDDTNPHQAIDFASFVVDDNILVMGGSVNKKKKYKTYSKAIHLYNLKTGYWYQLDDMPYAKECKGLLIDDTIYLIGGFNNNPLKSIETFDLKTGNWEKESELFYGIAKPALAHKNKTIYIFNNGSMFTYNIKTKVLKQYQINLFVESAEMFYYNNKLYILGGFLKGKYSTSPSSGLYSVDLKEFETTKTSLLKK